MMGEESVKTYDKQAFHDTGRYLLSAGHDQIINLVSSDTLGYMEVC